MSVDSNADFCAQRAGCSPDFDIVLMKHLLSWYVVNIVLHHLLIDLNCQLLGWTSNPSERVSGGVQRGSHGDTDGEGTTRVRLRWQPCGWEVGQATIVGLE